MTWTTVGSILGPKGDKGDTGDTGTPGTDGTGVAIKGTVANSAALPGSGNVDGDAYITSDTGDLHVFNDGAFTDVGRIQGPKGDTGLQGPKGDTGDTGLQGPKGDTGSTGTAGAAGAKGDTGSTGSAGATGSTGARGSKWFTGSGDPDPVALGLAGAVVGDLYLDAGTGAGRGNTYVLNL